jgi:hypothetical protein
VTKSHPTLYSLLIDNVSSPLHQEIIAVLLIFIQSILVNKIMTTHRLSRESSLMAGLTYAVMSSLLYQNVGLSAILVANTFIILALDELLSLYKSNSTVVQLFNLGFFTGCAACCYIPYSSYFLFAIVGVLIIRSFKILDLAQLLIGFFIPYFLIFTYKYYFDLPFGDLNYVQDVFFRIPLFNISYPLITYVSIGLIMFFTILSVLFYRKITYKKAVQVKKKFDVVYWLLLFAGLSMLTFQSQMFEHLLAVSIPISLGIGALVSDSPNRLYAEIIHLLLLTIIVVGQYQLITI